MNGESRDERIFSRREINSKLERERDMESHLIAAQPITSGHKYPLMNHKFLSPDKKKVRIAVTETIDQSGQDTHWKERIKSCYILPVRSFGLIMLW